MNRFANEPIVVPTDYSDEAQRALDLALEIANAPERVVALHVAPPLTTLEPGFVDFMIDDAERTKKLAASFAQRHSDAKYRGVRFEVRFGDPGSEITRFASELGAGLIVMPSHGRTGFAHLLIGSVAERVVRLAKNPVLIIRA